MIIKKPLQYATVIDRQGECGVFDTMEDAIRLAYIAAEEYSKCTIDKRNEITHTVIRALEEHLEELSLMASKEITNNSYEDILYNSRAALTNYNNDNFLEARLSTFNKSKTTENLYTIKGIIVSNINPIETLIKNSILMLKTGNPIVFSSEKNIKHVFSYTIKLINNAIQAVNGPNNLLVTVKEPSDENTKIMIKHKKVALISTENTNNVENIAL